MHRQGIMASGATGERRHARGPRAAALAALATGLAGLFSSVAGLDSPSGTRAAAGVPLLGVSDAGVYPGLRSVRELSLPGGRAMDAGIGVYPALSATTRFTFPAPVAVAAAKRFAASRQGRIAFAVADPRGGIRGLDVSRPYSSASLVKAMLLVAYLGRLERLGEKLRPAAHARLDAMIRSSDNYSASAVFGKVGPAGLRELAARAGMKSFAAGATWGAARVTAADQARFFLSLDRLLPAGRAPFARDLMARIMPEHSWGIPAAARPRWQVFFKGGWRPQPGGDLVHQGALLQDRSRRFSLVVLTVGNPSHSYGTETVRGLASILLTAGRGSPSDDRAPAPAPSAGELVPVRELPPGDGASPPELFPIGAGSAR